MRPERVVRLSRPELLEMDMSAAAGYFGVPFDTIPQRNRPVRYKLMSKRKPNRYAAIIARVFSRHYTEGATAFEFSRGEIEDIAKSLRIELPKNLGDLIYSFRFRTSLPEGVLATAPPGQEWTIKLAGQARYRFVLGVIVRIVPRPDLLAIKIPDATPELLAAHALTDEQALLAKVRYNRLVDIFLGVAAYSLQNHLRTTVKFIGQIEVDEVYLGVNKHGKQFVIPVQAKGGSDHLGAAQIEQDIACCAEKFPNLICRPIAAQFMPGEVIALFELVLSDGVVKVVEEKHYKLVPAAEIRPEDLLRYAES